jgi:DNA polymerase III epsilon subunit-like protein
MPKRLNLIYKFGPYSKNIIFFDSEFSSLNPYKGEILSIGMVKMDGSELYLELEYDGDYDLWVKKNILPTLKGKKVTRQEATRKIQEFVGGEKPYMVTYVNQYDTIYTYKLFTSKIFNDKKHPFFWLPIDFASILFGMGIDPGSYFLGDKKNFFRKVGINPSKYKSHNALDDAKLLREVYLKMVSFPH